MGGMEPRDARVAHPSYVGSISTLDPARGSQDSQGAVSAPPPLAPAKGCIPWEQSRRQRGGEAGCAASVWNGFFITVLISQSVALHENKALDRTGKKGLWRQHANIATSLKQNNPKKSVSRGRGRALPTGWRVQRLPFNHHFCRWGFLFVCPFHWLIYFIIILLLLTFFSLFFSFFFLLLITLKNKIRTLVKHPALSWALLEIIKNNQKNQHPSPPPTPKLRKQKTTPK